jgi:hypothetical protein
MIIESIAFRLNPGKCNANATRASNVRRVARQLQGSCL